MREDEVSIAYQVRSVARSETPRVHPNIVDFGSKSFVGLFHFKTH